MTKETKLMSTADKMYELSTNAPYEYLLAKVLYEIEIGATQGYTSCRYRLEEEHLNILERVMAELKQRGFNAKHQVRGAHVSLHYLYVDWSRPVAKKSWWKFWD